MCVYFYVFDIFCLCVSVFLSIFYFFCLSKHPFHPELQDAICYHIYACLNRPVDPDELFYFLRSINENETKSSKPTTN